MVLDARPDGIIYRDLIPEYVNFARTIYEGVYFQSSFSILLGIGKFEHILYHFLFLK